MSEQIKPCPFCGGNEIDVYHVTAFDYYKSVCRKCKIEIKAKTEQEVMKLWNSRARPPLPDDIREIIDYLSEGESQGFPTYYEKRLAEYITKGK